MDAFWTTVTHTLETFPQPSPQGRDLADTCRIWQGFSDPIDSACQEARKSVLSNWILLARRQYERILPALLKICSSAGKVEDCLLVTWIPLSNANTTFLKRESDEVPG
ncbi:unnamed protein product [Sympodiomycopsis kandeliae]